MYFSNYVLFSYILLTCIIAFIFTVFESYIHTAEKFCAGYISRYVWVFKLWKYKRDCAAVMRAIQNAERARKKRMVTVLQTLNAERERCIVINGEDAKIMYGTYKEIEALYVPLDKGRPVLSHEEAIQQILQEEKDPTPISYI